MKSIETALERKKCRKTRCAQQLSEFSGWAMRAHWTDEKSAYTLLPLLPKEVMNDHHEHRKDLAPARRGLGGDCKGPNGSIGRGEEPVMKREVHESLIRPVTDSEGKS